MHKYLNTAALQPRLWIATVLLFALSVAFVAQFFDSVSYFDDARPVRFIKVSESSKDGESPSSSSPEPVALPVSDGFITCSIIFALVVLPRRRLTLRLAHLYRLPSRAPPSLLAE